MNIQSEHLLLAMYAGLILFLAYISYSRNISNCYGPCLPHCFDNYNLIIVLLGIILVLMLYIIKAKQAKFKKIINPSSGEFF